MYINGYYSKCSIGYNCSLVCSLLTRSSTKKKMAVERLLQLCNSFVFYLKVCSDWREIALTIRDRVFEDDEEQLIDIHDVKVSTV